MDNNIAEIKQLLFSRTETLIYPQDLSMLFYTDSRHLEQKHKSRRDIERKIML